jgi:hypothetical protein
MARPTNPRSPYGPRMILIALSCFSTVIVFRYYNSIAASDFQEFCGIFAIRSEMRPYR